MSIRSFFGGKEDPISAYKSQLVTAVKEGDIEGLRLLLQKEIEAPPAVYDAALVKAVANNQTRMAKLLIDAPGSRTLDHSHLRSVVYNGKTEMFRLLKDAGWNFAAAVPSENGASYVSQLRYMEKDFEADRLKAELAATQKELAALKETCAAAPAASVNTGPIDDLPRRPKKPSL
ncbi:MAG TPA: hypothetical protein VEF76_03105 [Patescibacteria group bacterium]|nr:hypothetical protein [Patescibacteria group bacterium]